VVLLISWCRSPSNWTNKTTASHGTFGQNLERGTAHGSIPSTSKDLFPRARQDQGFAPRKRIGILSNYGEAAGVSVGSVQHDSQSAVSFKPYALIKESSKMMRNIGKVFLTLCLLTVGTGVVANAQIETDARIEANIPFAFAVSNTTLPAGKYEIRTVDENIPSILELRSADGRTKVIFETEDAQTPGGDQRASKTELTFDKVGDRYFLSQVWLAGDAAGNQLPKSKMEKKLMDGGGQAERHSIVAFLKHAKR